MTSIIKVDQIQNAAGGTPTAADLGLNVSGSVLQVKSSVVKSNILTTSTSNVSTGLSVSYTPLYSTSTLVITLEGGRFWCSTSGQQLNLDLYKDGASVTGGIWTAIYSNGTMHVPNYQRWEEAASTTSARTYEVYFNSSSGYGMYLNEASVGRIPISLVVYEIAG